MFSKKPMQPTHALPNHSIFRQQITLVNDYLEDEDHEIMRDLPEFKPLYELKKQARRLLGFIKEADWASMDKMHFEGRCDMWSVMTCLTSHVLSDGKTKEYITPLRYTAKIFDRYSRERLLSYVPDKCEHFLEHLQEQKEHIDLQPLFNAYQNYINIDRSWLKDQASCAEASAYWSIAHGLQVRELVQYARHFIKEMCRWNGAWQEDAAFDDANAPVNCIFADYTGNFKEIKSFACFVNELGITCSLAKGTNLMPCGPRIFPASETVAFDFAVFKRLLEVRQNDLKMCFLPCENKSRQTSRP